MREYDIVRAPAPLDWEKVPTLAIDTPLWGTTADIAAWAQICWDDEGLLVRLRARERDIRAEYTGLTAVSYTHLGIRRPLRARDRQLLRFHTRRQAVGGSRGGGPARAARDRGGLSFQR